jgi:Lsr2
MKTLEIKSWDDVHAQEGVRIESARTVSFSFDKTDYELDLTAEHAAELEQLLAPWIKAAHPPSNGLVLTRMRKPGSAESREFYAGLRAWAKAVGRDDEHWTSGKNGQPRQLYYPRQMVTDYEAYLLSQAERQAS